MFRWLDLIHQGTCDSDLSMDAAVLARRMLLGMVIFQAKWRNHVNKFQPYANLRREVQDGPGTNRIQSVPSKRIMLGSSCQGSNPTWLFATQKRTLQNMLRALWLKKSRVMEIIPLYPVKKQTTIQMFFHSNTFSFSFSTWRYVNSRASHFSAGLSQRSHWTMRDHGWKWVQGLNRT